MPVAVLGESNIRYFTGAAGLAGVLLVTPKAEWMIASDTDLALTTGFNVVKPKKKSVDELVALLDQQRIRRLGVDFGQLSYSMYKKLATRRVRLVDVGNRIRAMREIKGREELRRLKEACRIADKAMALAAGSIRPGVTERSVRTEALAVLRECEVQAFDFIVASGPNSLYTHCFPTARKIGRSDLVIVDLGVSVEGYHSDITRTFCLDPGEEQRRVYAAVLEAQEVALSAMRPGAKCRDVCEKVGRFFERSNLRKYWKYGLGHGVGLDVHESPSIRSDSGDVLRTGETFTVEPGLHVPGLGGVRIEDVVLLGKRPEKLTRYGYGLIP